MNAILEQINSTGKIFVEFALPMLVQSSVLILILLLADFALRKKLRAVFRYWIWLLVLLKLLLPTSLSSPLSLGYFFGDGLAYVDIAQTTEEPHVTVVDPTPASVPPFIDLTNIEAYRHTPTVPPIIPDTGPAVTEPINSPVVSVTPVTWQGAVFLVWLTVVMAMGLLLLQRAIFVRGLVAQAKEANGFMTDTLESCRRSMGVKRKLGLKVSANATSPAVCGLFRPVILVPQNLTSSISKSQLRAVLLHELAHIRRGDLWVNLAQTFLQIIYFYNPLLWLANCVIRRVREQAVDEMVLVAMGEKAQQYPQTLVNMAKLAFKRPALSLRLIGVVESKSALAGRIKHILNCPMPKRAKLGILGLLVVIIIAAILLPMAKSIPGPPSLVIKGTVKDAQTGEPIAGARVFDDGYGPKPNWEQIKANKRFEWGAITNSAGEYSFLTWPEHHSIKIEAPGYKAERRSLYSGHFVFNKKDEENIDFILESEEVLESSEFKKTLPNGVTVELVGICEHPSEGKQWWRPDGSKLGQRPFEKLYQRIHTKREFYELALKIENPKNRKLSIIGEGNQVFNLYSDKIWGGYVLSEGKKMLNQSVGIAQGPWKTIAEANPRHTQSIGDIAFGKAFESDFEGIGTAVGVTVTHTIDKEKVDYRIIAVDQKNNIHASSGHSGIGSSSWMQTTVHFKDLQIDEIKEFRFQTRPYEWVEFKNVSLRPGVKTDVQVEVGNTDTIDWIVEDYGQTRLLSQKEIIETDNWVSIRASVVKNNGRYLVPDSGLTLKGLIKAAGYNKDKLAESYVELIRRSRQGNITALSIYSRNLKTLLSGEESDIVIKPHDAVLGGYIEASANAGDFWGQYSFSDVVELTVNDDGAKINMFADLDTGKLVTPPDTLDNNDENAVFRWIKDNGIDVMGETADSVHGLVGFNMYAARVDNYFWDADPVEFTDRLLIKINDPVLLSVENLLPVTYLITTTEHKMGILQILGFAEKPKGIKIRYKLLNKANIAKTDVRIEAEPIAGDWQYAGQAIPPDFNDTMILAEHVNLGSIGQDAEGKTFITFVRDGEKTQNRQYRFVLFKKDGNILEPDGHIVLDQSKRLEEKFTFSEPFVSRRLKGFRFQSRPLPLAGTDNISSQLQKAASEEVKNEKISPSKLAPPGRYAIELDGVDDYLLVPDNPSLRLEPPFTVEMWVKAKLSADASEYRGGWAVISKGFYVGTPRAYVTGFGIKLDRRPNEPSMLYIDFCKANNSGIYTTTYGGYPLTNGVSDWIHITHVFDGEYYKSTPGHPLVMGKFLIPTENPLMGQLGEVRLWNGARTREELRQYKNVALTGNEPGLAACWTFEQTEGQYAYDISGNNNHARLGKSIEDDDADPKWVNLQAPSPKADRKTDVQVETEKPQSLIFHGLDLTAVPHTTNYSRLPDLFEERPLGSKSYHIQKDVTAIYSGLDGTVYFIPRRNIFYVQHDKLGSSTLTYYGPFEGNPVQVLNLQPDVQVEDEPVVGEWEDIGKAVPADFNDTISLAEHITVASIGQDVEGKTFITLLRDKEKTKDQQYRFVLVGRNGTVVEPASYSTLLFGDQIGERFSFDMPYQHRQIKEFRLQRFPQNLEREASLPLVKPYDPHINGKMIASATSGPPGQGALHFNGKGDYLYVPDSPSLCLGPTFTVEMWIKPEFPKEQFEHRTSWDLIGKGCIGKDWIFGRGKVEMRGFGITLHRFGDDPNLLMVDYCAANDKGIYGKSYGRRDFDNWMHLYHVFSPDRYKPGHGYPLVVGKFLIPESPFAGQIGEIRIWRGARSRDQISEYRNKPLTGDEPDLVACWIFEQSEGQIAYDISTNRNHARLGTTTDADEADPTWVSVTDSSTLYKEPGNETDDQVLARSTVEPIGRHALSFDGVDDYLHVAANSTLTLKSPFTIEMWLKPDYSDIPRTKDSEKLWPFLSLLRKGKRLFQEKRLQAGGFMMFVGSSSRQDGKSYGYLYLGNEDGRLYQVGLSDGDRLQPERPGWIHVSMSCTRETYIPVPKQPLMIGQNIVLSGFSFKGDIAEIRLWSGVRSGGQVARYRNKPLNGNEPGLVACWDFKRPGGQIVFDISPNGNHARLGGSEGPDDADPKWVNLKAASHQPDQKIDVQAEIENHLFSVYGTVTDQSGRPIAGVQLTADCGHEKLERTGRAVSDENGRYALGLTSSIKVLHVDPYDVGIQTARIKARAQGFYEASLCRQGNLAMAGKPPGPDEQRFVADYAGVVLPHKPYELNFVMHLAARIEGKFVDERGRSILRRPVWLSGDGLLKNTSLSGLSYGNGTFTIDHVPCGTVWFTTINRQLVQSGAVNLATPGTYRVQLQFGESPSGRPTLRIAEFQAPEPSLAESARPRVIDPNGNPVAGAQVALCTKDKGVVIRAGKLGSNRMGGRTTTILETDADGSFDFSDRPDDFHLIVAHEKGLAWITREQFTSSPEIRLQSWGRIEGYLYIGRESAADKKMSLLNYINKNAIDQGVRYEYETDTDAGGKFVFDKVPPGWLEIGYLTRMGNSSWSQTGRTPVQINPGVTLRVAIGGRGRPVVGKFVPPLGYDRPVYFGEGLRVLNTVRPERPKPENYDRMSKRERQQWYDQWSKTPEAGAYYDVMWHDPGRRHYVFHIKKDGSFRIEDVIAGKYQLTVWIEERLTGQGRPEEIAGYYGTIEVPEIPGGRSDEPLDLGELELTMHNPLRVGDIAPLFEAKTLEGKDLRLIDYRGKFVLLSFWQPVFHPEKQQLQELYDTYGGNRQLEIIGLGGNDTLEEVKNYVRENAIPWLQIYTGEEYKSGIAKDYGGFGIFLIDTDGRIIAKDLRGDKLKSVVSEALEVANVNKTDVRAEVERSDKSSESKSSRQAVEKLPEMRGRVYGVVVNSVTGEPIAGAYVGVGDFGDSGGSNYSRHRQQGLYAKAQTDEEGRFVLEGVAFRDDHPLVVTHPEFVRHDMKVAVQRGGPEPEIKVSLRPAAKINVTVVDSNGKLLEGFWFIRLEALDGRYFIPPGRDRHLSSFASSIWMELPKPKLKPDKKSLSGTTGFSFTELDSGEYSIDVIKFTITDNYTPPPAGMVRLPLDTSNITYYGGIANLKIEDGQTNEVAIKPANYQTSVTIKMPDDPVKKPHIPPFVVISRNVGLLLWNDEKAHGPEDHRLGRLVKNALYYNMVVDGDVLTIKNLPPGSYSVFAGPIYFMNAVRMKVLSGREVTVEIPVIQLSEHAKVGLWTFDRKVKPEAGSYSVSDLCELISAKTGSNPRIIAEASIQNEKLKLSEREMSVWDLLETLYLEKGWKLKEGAKKTLVLYPAAKADVQVGVEKH